MTSLTQQLERQLAEHNLDMSDWRALIQRLLDYGVLCRDDSQVEAEFYDQFVRVHALVDEYLQLMGVRFQHDTHFQFVRIIPPGARVPGVEDETDQPFNGGFRQRLSQHEIALILVLRAEYDKGLREGLIDEQGCTALSLEAVALAMKNLLRRTLPENLGERKQVFKRLRQLRLIHYVQEADLDLTESWIKIRPLIINLVTNEWLDKIRQDLSAHPALLEADASNEDTSDEAASDTTTSNDGFNIKKAGGLNTEVRERRSAKQLAARSKSVAKEKSKADKSSLFPDNH